MKIPYRLVYGFIAACLLFFSHTAFSQIVTEELKYTIDGQEFTGFLAYDDSTTSPRPGIILVHEWWGHNPYVRNRAKQLAGLGYTAFALDMYGTGKLAEHPKDAKNFMMQVFNDMPMAEKRFNTALDIIKSHSTVNPEQTAAIGYCFGGAMVLHMARRGADLDAVASFHGSLGTKAPAQAGKLNARVLVYTGADDPMVPAKQVDAFLAEMKAANASLVFKSYQGVKHSFTNPEADSFAEKFKLPLAYDSYADKDSWHSMLTSFKYIFEQ